jgi:hypothetical protein
MTIEFTIDGLAEFEAAVKRNPEYVEKRGKVFIVRSLAEYRKRIVRSPWQFGAPGGGAPVATGNLRDTHQTEVVDLTGRIFPTAPYAKYVHGIEGFPRKRSYQLRPWLDYAASTALPDIEKHEEELLKDIVSELAS